MILKAHWKKCKNSQLYLEKKTCKRDEKTTTNILKKKCITKTKILAQSLIKTENWQVYDDFEQTGNQHERNGAAQRLKIQICGNKKMEKRCDLLVMEIYTMKYIGNK